MNKFKKHQKSSPKNYLIVVSLVMVVMVLFVNFQVLPALTKVVVKISPGQAEKIKKQVLNISVVSLFSVLLLNFFVWKIDSRLEEEIKKAQEILRINVNDPVAQKKVKAAEEKRERYLTMMEPIFLILLGAMVAWMIKIVLIPLYHLEVLNSGLPILK